MSHIQSANSQRAIINVCYKTALDTEPDTSYYVESTVIGQRTDSCVVIPLLGSPYQEGGGDT